jgi:abortive infection bacteriophage resistance protein
MLYGELEKIEVAIRAKMIYTLSHLYGAFWYTNVNLFSNNNKHANTLASLNKEYTRSNEDFLLAFRANYTDPMPPSWMMLEASSFGNLSNLYSNLRPGKAKRSIANHFGLDETTFASWIHSIGYIRNMCAHHSRLWNKKLSIPAAIPTTPANDFLIVTQNINSITNAIELVNNKTYYILSMMIYLLNIINPKNKFKKNFFLLLKKYPHADIGAMGFTSSWKDELIWKINKQPLNEIISDLMKKVKNHLSSFFFP